jgi:hypothetical protein
MLSCRRDVRGDWGLVAVELGIVEDSYQVPSCDDMMAGRAKTQTCGDATPQIQVAHYDLYTMRPWAQHQYHLMLGARMSSNFLP